MTPSSEEIAANPNKENAMPDQDAFQKAVAALYAGIAAAASQKEFVLQAASALREVENALQIRASVKPHGE